MCVEVIRHLLYAWHMMVANASIPLTCRDDGSRRMNHSLGVFSLKPAAVVALPGELELANPFIVSTDQLTSDSNAVSSRTSNIYPLIFSGAQLI